MKILAIDTSSNICSVAVLEDTDVIIEKHIEGQSTHSVKLMPLIDEILKSTNLSLYDFDIYSCSIGPGSFTGIRIGVSTIKAFSDVTSINIVGVNSLESLAYNVFNSNFKNDAKLICSMIDAKNDNVYFGMFEKENNTLKQILELKADNIENIIEYLKKYHSSKIIFVGNGCEKHQYLLQKHFSKSTFVEDKHNKQTATSVGISAFYNYKNGNYGDSNFLVPMYLKKSQAERALEGEL